MSDTIPLFEIIVNALFFIFLLSSPLIAYVFSKNRQFKKSSIGKKSGKSFASAMKDKGLAGEYYTELILRKMPGNYKIVTNAYIPNGRGGTTEIDLLFIHETGLYVMESKNYTGWIFGDESHKNWTQTFPNGKKCAFYNPIKQNKGHINALEQLLDFVPSETYASIIVFSERCELKQVPSNKEGVSVLKRDRLSAHLKSLLKRKKKVFDKKMIQQIYDTVNPYSEVTQLEKDKHVEIIEKFKTE